MARDFLINGETMVVVKGNVTTAISSSTQLGLAASPVVIRFTTPHRDINLDAWGSVVPADVQWMLEEASISMDLIHLDRGVLAICINEAAGGVVAEGLISRAGQRIGGNNPRFAAGWHYVSLGLSSPVLALPWRFYNAYLVSGVEIPLGTEKSIYRCNFRAIPYTQDPWQGGLGAQNQILFDHGIDS